LKRSRKVRKLTQMLEMWSVSRRKVRPDAGMILCSLDNVKDGHPLREVGQLEN
jgi:hypothetical protein